MSRAKPVQDELVCDDDSEPMLQVWFMTVKQNVTDWWQEYSDTDFRKAFGEWFDALRKQSQNAEARQVYVERVVEEWFEEADEVEMFDFGRRFDALRRECSNTFDVDHTPYNISDHFVDMALLRRHLRNTLHPDKYAGVSDSESRHLLTMQYQEMDKILLAALPQPTWHSHRDDSAAGDPSAATP